VNQLAACASAAQSATCDEIAGHVQQCGMAGCDLDFVCKIKGALPDDAPCSVDAQCATGVCAPNNGPFELDCGTCAHYVAVGDLCTMLDEVCDPQTSYCDYSCIAYAQVGEDCKNAKCAAPLVCDLPTHSCVTPPLEGQACSSDCAAPFLCVNATCAQPVQQGGACPTGSECAPNLGCDAQTHTCEPPQIVGVGQACGPFTQPWSVCEPGLTCVGTLGTERCIRPQERGEPCDNATLYCADFLSCIGGTCQIPDFSQCK
jgi:hypothetical protein